VNEVIADTGPLLHLYEIDQLKALGIFPHLTIPDLVAEELQNFGIDAGQLELSGLETSVAIVEKDNWETVITEADQPPIQPANAQEFFLAQSNQFQQLVLTDDLALRRRLENKNATVVGSVGILVRAYTAHLLDRNELKNAVKTLCTASTLHMSSPFWAYVRHLIADIP